MPDRHHLAASAIRKIHKGCIAEDHNHYLPVCVKKTIDKQKLEV